MHIDDLYKLYLQYPHVQTDTRKIVPGCIFFALKGANFDGNTFAQQALASGAARAVVDDVTLASVERCIVVPDVLDTLQHLANHHRRQLQVPFLAITGSNGKTTTKELIARVLAAKFKTSATIGNLNNHIGVPLTLLSIGQHIEIAVVEMGANHQKEIESYCTIAEPTHGLITNCGKAHIEGFGGVEGVRKGKGELYDYLKENNGIIFRNADLDYLDSMAAGIEKQITYGRSGAMYTGSPFLNGVFLSVTLKEEDSQLTINTKLVGEYNFDNVMAAVAVGRYFGVPLQAIRDAIASYEPDNSRSQWLEKGTNKIILDAYNANPSSMKAAITNFGSSPGNNSKILWLGGMKEMGTEERNEHQHLLDLIATYSWSEVLLVGNEFIGMNHPYRWFADSRQAAVYVKENMPENSTILIKGSRGSRMEILAEVLD